MFQTNVSERTLLAQANHQRVCTFAEAEILFGEEGAQVLKHVVEIHKDMNQALGDVTSLQLITGLIKDNSKVLFMYTSLLTALYVYICRQPCMRMFVAWLQMITATVTATLSCVCLSCGFR